MEGSDGRDERGAGCVCVKGGGGSNRLGVCPGELFDWGLEEEEEEEV